MEGTAAVFKEAGYKSAEAYLVELKLAATADARGAWLPLVTHSPANFGPLQSLCKRSVRRNTGAQEQSTRSRPGARGQGEGTEKLGAQKNRLAFPKESFLFASIWILREDELENLDVSDVKVEDKL